MSNDVPDTLFLQNKKICKVLKLYPWLAIEIEAEILRYRANILANLGVCSFCGNGFIRKALNQIYCTKICVSNSLKKQREVSRATSK